MEERKRGTEGKINEEKEEIEKGIRQYESSKEQKG